jgi:cell division transport system permease protein
MKHLFGNLKYHWGLHLVSGLVMVAGISLIVAILTFSQNLKTILTVWGENLQMNAYLSEEVSSEEVAVIDQLLKSNDKVEKIEYIDQKNALEMFRQQMAQYAPDLAADQELTKAIPASFQIALSSQIPAEKHMPEMVALAQQIQAMKGVEEVSYGQEWIKSYAAILSGIDWIGLIFISVIFLGALFVAANVIRSSISQRRDEIELLELLGAPRNFIRAPFIAEGAVMGFLSSLVAIALSFGVFKSALTAMSAELSLLQMANLLKFLSLNQILVVVVFSTLFSALAAYLCLKNINTGWSASQRLKAKNA